MIARAHLLKALTGGFLLLTTACGYTSSMQTPTAASVKPQTAVVKRSSDKAPDEIATPDLSMYDTVVVLDFKKDVSTPESPDAEFKNGEVLFANLVARAIENKNVFKTVSRKPVEGKAVIISGVITEYNEGNNVLKTLVGLGAGMTEFDATVSISDNTDKKPLGAITVDKNSWALGGAIAADQDIGSLMYDASLKIALEMEKAKAGKPTAK